MMSPFLKSQDLGTHLFPNRLVVLVSNQVCPFMRVFFVIVQFFGSILVTEVTISFRLSRRILRTITEKGHLASCRWVLQEWQNGTPLQMGGLGDACKITEAWIDIDVRDRLVVAKSVFAHAGQDDHKGNTGRVSPDGCLAPVGFLPEVPAMITG